jgi:hypothetical protein
LTFDLRTLDDAQVLLDQLVHLRLPVAERCPADSASRSQGKAR